MGAECFAVTVQPSGDLSGLPEADREAVERHLNFARNLHIEARILEGEDMASERQRENFRSIAFPRNQPSLVLRIATRNSDHRKISTNVES